MSTVTMIAAHDSPTSILGILSQAEETLLLKATKKLCPTWLKAYHLSMCPQAVFTGLKKQKEHWASRTWWGIILLFYWHLFSDWISVVTFLSVKMLSILSVLWLGFFSFSNWFVFMSLLNFIVRIPYPTYLVWHRILCCLLLILGPVWV